MIHTIIFLFAFLCVVYDLITGGRFGKAVLGANLMLVGIVLVIMLMSWIHSWKDRR